MSRSSRFSVIRTLFNIGKKFIDVLDDIWSALRPYLPADLIQTLTPFVMGGIGFITHLGEGIQAARKAQRAYQNKAIGQRYTRLTSAILITLIAGSGMGVALSLGAAILGAAVSATFVSAGPIIIPALLAVIYGVALWRKAYIFSKAKEKEAWCRRDYLTALSRKIDPYRIDLLRKRYEESRRYRLRAERKVAFNVIEVLASSLIVVSTVLGTAAIVGGSFASFGILPIALVVAGVILGAGSKLLDYLDKKFNYRLSLWLRSCFVSQTEGEKNILLTPEKTQRHSDLHKKMMKVGMIEMVTFNPNTQSLSRCSTKSKPKLQVRVDEPTREPALNGLSRDPEEVLSPSKPSQARGTPTPSPTPTYFGFSPVQCSPSTVAIPYDSETESDDSETESETATKSPSSSPEACRLYRPASPDRRAQQGAGQWFAVSRAPKGQTAVQRS